MLKLRENMQNNSREMQVILVIVKNYSNSNKHKKYVLSNSESVQCNFFIFDHVTLIQFKICCWTFRKDMAI